MVPSGEASLPWMNAASFGCLLRGPWALLGSRDVSHTDLQLAEKPRAPRRERKTGRWGGQAWHPVLPSPEALGSSSGASLSVSLPCTVEHSPICLSSPGDEGSRKFRTPCNLTLGNAKTAAASCLGAQALYCDLTHPWWFIVFSAFLPCDTRE